MLWLDDWMPAKPSTQEFMKKAKKKTQKQAGKPGRPKKKNPINKGFTVPVNQADFARLSRKGRRWCREVLLEALGK